MRPAPPRAAFLPVVALALALAPAARAQHTDFEPRLFLLYSYSSNVDVVDSTGSAADEGSDTVANLGLELPLTREMRFGSLGLAYGGVYTKYDRNSLYDNMAHSLSFRVSPRLRRGATLDADVYYTLSQDQGTARRIEDDEQFLAARTDRTFYGAGVQYNKDGRRSFWDAQLRGTRAEFEAIEGTLPEVPPTDPLAFVLIPESRTFWYGSFEFRHKFNRRFSLGPRYELGYTQLERNNDELYHVLSAAFSWVLSEFVSIDANVGAYRREAEGDVPEGVEVADSTGFSWLLDLQVDPPLAAVQRGRIKVGFELGISPRGGGALQGTSTDSYLRLYLASGTARSPWSWDAGVRYTRRESTIETFPTLETAGLGGFVEYGIGSLLSIRLSGGWSEQLNAQTDETNASFGNAGLGLVVYPRGRLTTRGGSAG